MLGLFPGNLLVLSVQQFISLCPAPEIWLSVSSENVMFEGLEDDKVKA